MKTLPLLTALALSTGLMTASPSAIAADSPIYRAVLGVGSDASEATLTWRTHSTTPEMVELTGPDGTRTIVGEEYDSGQVLYRSIHATLTDLKPATTYTYRIGSQAGGWSATYSFTTSATGSEWSFLAFGDPQIGTDLKIEEQQAAWKKTLDTATADFPDAAFYFSLGDQIEGWGDPNVQYEAFFTPNQLRTEQFAVLEGNHETYGAGGLAHHAESFTNPNEQDPTGDYYFTYNNALIVALNSNSEDWAAHRAVIGEAQASHPDAAWTIVAFHKGPFSQGTHWDDTDSVAIRDHLAPILSDLGVDLVLNAHDHIYARSDLMHGTVPKTAGVMGKRGDAWMPQPGDTLYVTVSSATGGKFYDFQGTDGSTYPEARMENIDPTLVQPYTDFWRQDYTPDYSNIQVTDTTLTVTTYNVDTPYVVDQVTLVKPAASGNQTPNQAPDQAPKQLDPASTNPTATNPTATDPTATNGSDSDSSDDPVTVALTTIVSLLGVLGLLGAIAWNYREQWLPYVK